MPESDTNGKAGSEFERLAGKQAEGGIVSDFWYFISSSKKWWMAPVIVILLLFGVLLLLGGTAAAPFIYTLF